MGRQLLYHPMRVAGPKEAKCPLGGGHTREELSIKFSGELASPGLFADRLLSVDCRRVPQEWAARGPQAHTGEEPGSSMPARGSLGRNISGAFQAIQECGPKSCAPNRGYNLRLRPG